MGGSYGSRNLVYIRAQHWNMGDRHSRNWNGERGQGTRVRTFFDAGPDTILAVRTTCCAPSQPARQGDEGRCQGSPGSVQ